MSTSPLFSVIVPSYNARGTIRRCLQSIQDQDTNASYEAIVVDSSDDGTDEIIRQEFGQVLLLRLEQRTSVGDARNCGLSNAAGAFVAFTDADCIVPRDWLSQLHRQHQEAAYAAVGGSVANGTPRSLVGSADHLLEFSEFLPQARPRLVTNIPTCNICYRASALVDARFNGGPQGRKLGSEDLILNWELTRRGAKLLFDPAIRVVHLNRTRLGAYLGHQHLLGRSSCWARKCTNLPGQIFVDYPLLGLALPLLRLARIAVRLNSIDRSALLRLMAFSPLIFFGASAWAVGFMREAMQHKG